MTFIINIFFALCIYVCIYYVYGITSRACQKLGMIKRVLFSAPKEVHKLAFSTLCPPFMGYVCEVWDSYVVRQVTKLEVVHGQVVCFIAKLRVTRGATLAI